MIKKLKSVMPNLIQQLSGRKAIQFISFTAGLLLTGFSAFSEVKFGNLDINYKNQVLFSIEHDIPGALSYSTLAKADLKNGKAENIEVVTVFPEKMEYLADGSNLQLRNRYGTAWYNTMTNTFAWKKSNSTIPLNSMRLAPNSVSPNGKFSCYVEKKGYANGELIVENLSTGKKKVLDYNAGFSYDSIPVKWSEDSSILIYLKGKTIYFCNPEALIKGIEVEEKFRKIGNGTINSINWAGSRNIIYIDNDIIYKINSKELYTLGLYSGIIGRGSAIGRLSSSFNPEKDIFSMNSDLDSIVLIQNGKNFIFAKIISKICDYVEVLYSRPYVDLKASLLEAGVLWNNNDAPSIWIRQLPYSGDKVQLCFYTLNDKLVKLLELENSSSPVISPDKKKCAVYQGETVSIYDTTYWKQQATLSGDKVVSVLWQNNSVLVVGGQRVVRSWDYPINESKVLLLSSVADSGWGLEGKIVASTGGSKDYIFDEDRFSWKENGSVTIKHNQSRNDRYRVFCSETPNANFENALMVRNLVGKSETQPVYPESMVKTDERNKVALIFDAYDNADGLTRIINQLSIYNIKGTFFLNGEFIRRYPNETKQISNTQNESGSMFFSVADLCSNNFRVDSDYIRRGLARNEDEFYQGTGKELGMLWHAPFYSVTKEIKEWSKDPGYTYVDSTQTVSDMVTMEQAVAHKAVYYSCAELIEKYMNSLAEKGGGIIPVTVGISHGSRESYVYNNLDLLISAVLDAGYDIVPVRMMVE